MDAPKVTWDQTRAFRMHRMHLIDPLGPRSLVRLAGDLGGVHAQVASAADWQCALRADGLATSALERALWKQRRIVKTWLMRGTLHYLDADDLPLWTAAAAASYDHWRKAAWQKFNKLTTKDVERAIDAISEALDADEPKTREEIADAVWERHRKKALDELMRAGWGSILKIASWHGHLVFGPNRGRNVTFIRPERWLGRWHEADPDDALREVCRRYVGSHGPVTREEFARWWGFMPPAAGRVLKDLDDELELVDREGDKAFILRSDLDALLSAREDDSVRVLGMFDAYTLAGLPHVQIVPKERKPEVYRTGAWVSQVILRGGRVVGTWTHDRKAKATTVDVTLFKRGAASKREITDALEPLASRLGPVSSVTLTV